MGSVVPKRVAVVGGPLQTVRSWVPRVRSTLGRHWLFVAFVVVAVALRAIVSIAYWPALEFHADSFDYLRLANILKPGWWHPSGYALFLAPFSLIGQLAVVVVVQHLIGIAMGVIVYALAMRLGARQWLAAIAALPVLLDGYQLDLEQFILAETLTDLLLLGGLAVLLWREEVGVKRATVVGLLLAAACLTRTAVVPVLIVAAVYLLFRRPRWRPFMACCAAGAVVLGGYGGWYAATWGHFGYSDFTGVWLYGRVAPFANCDYRLPGKEAELCPPRPVGKRSDNPEYFADSQTSPVHTVHFTGRVQRNAVAERFAIAVIEHQPLAYAGAVLSDTWHYFTPGRWMTADRIDMRRWMFPPAHFSESAHSYHVGFATRGFHSRVTASPDPALIGPLRTYQSIFYTPGPLLLACLIGALGIGLGLARRGAGRRHARRAALVLAVSSIVVVLSPSMFAQFSYRYGLPLLALLPPAGAAAAEIGLDALHKRRAAGWELLPGRPRARFARDARGLGDPVHRRAPEPVHGGDDRA